MIHYLKKIKHYFSPPIINWIDEIEHLARKEKGVLKKFDKAISIDSPKKVLFFSAVPWERGIVEHLLALGLRSRGHDVFQVHCSGGFPFCAMQSMRIEKPNCDFCKSRALKVQSALQVKQRLEINEYISPEERKEAQKISQATSPEDAEHLTLCGIPVGKITLRDVPQYFFYIPEYNDPKFLEIWPDLLESAILYTYASNRMIESLKPERAIVTSGKTISFAYFFELCKLKSIPVVTWDESAFSRYKFTFSWNKYATEYSGEANWDEVKKQKLLPEQVKQMDEYFNFAQKGLIGFQNLYNQEMTQKHGREILKSIPLQNENYILLLSNVVWDTATLGLDKSFESMLDWLFKTIETLWDKNDVDLLIRVHPAETNVPDEWKTEITLDRYVQQQFGELPKHIHLVQGPDAPSSHRLAELSLMNIVYSTTAGLDLCMMGLRVLICGGVHYRNRGFTHDIDKKEEYLNLLLHPYQFNKYLNPEELELAKRYSNYFLFDSQVELKEFDLDTRQAAKLNTFKDYLTLNEGGNPVIERLCDAIIHQKPFYKING